MVARIEEIETQHKEELQCHFLKWPQRAAGSYVLAFTVLEVETTSRALELLCLHRKEECAGLQQGRESVHVAALLTAKLVPRVSTTRAQHPQDNNLIGFT